MQSRLATTTSSTAGPPAETSVAARGRLAQPLLLSIVAHLALLLALCLIVFPPPMGNSSILSLKIWSEQEFTDAFELSAVAEPELDDAIVEPSLISEDTSVNLDVPIPEIEPLALPQNESTSDPDSAENGASDRIGERAVLASSSSLVGAALASSRSIQQKVSQAGGLQGEVQFALAWKNINDLDIHVITPSGERISHLYKKSRFGGVLDVDMNVRGESKQPVENVRWLRDAPLGRYTVLVNLFRVHRPRAGDRVYRGADFQLLAHLGDSDQLESGVVSPRKQVGVFRFIYTGKDSASESSTAIREREASRQAAEEVTANENLRDAKKETANGKRQRLLNRIISRYPHTDAAIEAMQMLGGNITKNSL